MAIVPLAGRVRPGTGKGPARQARRLGFIPGVIYGHGENPVALSIPRNDFELALKTHRGGNVIVALRLDGGGEQTAIIREVQRDPISHDILHLDFHHISLTEKVQVEVNVHLVGVPDGVKNGGGILEHITRSIAIECLPTEIPPRIDVDVSALTIGDSVHVREITVEKAEVLTDGDVTIATVVPPTVLAEPAPGEAAATTAEPEVITKGKGEEGAEKPEAGGKGEKSEKAEKKD
jgi:large subunit ribosomal protein L25